MSVRSLLHSLRRFRRLPPVNRWFAVEAALALLLARLLTRFTPARFWLRLLDTAPESGSNEATGAKAGEGSPPSPRTHDREDAEPAPDSIRSGARNPSVPRKVGRVVGKVVRHLPFRARCLPQAMAAQWMLRRRGVNSVLVFGARRSGGDGPLEFHAWLMAGGECVVGGNDIGSYSAFPPFAVTGHDR